MSHIILTVIVAFGLMLLALAMLGIGYIVTGKMKIKPGACGRAPDKKRDEDCGNDASCGLCEKDKDEKNDIR